MNKTSQTTQQQGGMNQGGNMYQGGNMSGNDYYETLGVNRNATIDDINRAYKRLSLQHHPDQYKNTMQSSQADINFQQISEAYQALSDPVRRRKYDEFIENPTTQQKTKEYMQNQQGQQGHMQKGQQGQMQQGQQGQMQQGQQGQGQMQQGQMQQGQTQQGHMQQGQMQQGHKRHPHSTFFDTANYQPMTATDMFNKELQRGLFNDIDLPIYGLRSNLIKQMEKIDEEFFGQQELNRFKNQSNQGVFHVEKFIKNYTIVDNGKRTSITEVKTVDPNGNVDKEVREETVDEKGNKQVRYLDRMPDEIKTQIKSRGNKMIGQGMQKGQMGQQGQGHIQGQGQGNIQNQDQSHDQAFTKGQGQTTQGQGQGQAQYGQKGNK